MQESRSDTRPLSVPLLRHGALFFMGEGILVVTALFVLVGVLFCVLVSVLLCPPPLVASS